MRISLVASLVEAWIETQIMLFFLLTLLVASLVEAWIETVCASGQRVKC